MCYFVCEKGQAANIGFAIAADTSRLIIKFFYAAIAKPQNVISNPTGRYRLLITAYNKNKLNATAPR